MIIISVSPNHTIQSVRICIIINNTIEGDEEDNSGHSVPLSEFVDYVDNMHTYNNNLFEKEFNVRAVNICDTNKPVI